MPEESRQNLDYERTYGRDLHDQVREIRDLIAEMRRSYRYSDKAIRSKIAIPIYSAPDEVKLDTERKVSRVAVSMLSDAVMGIVRDCCSVETRTSYPRWSWDREFSTTIGEAVEDVKKLFKSAAVSREMRSVDTESFTPLTGDALSKKFVASRRFIQATGAKVKYRVVINRHKGVDVAAAVDGSGGARYAVYVGVLESGSRPRVYSLCTCPVGSKGKLICKHLASVISASAPSILAAIDSIYAGAHDKIDDLERAWADALSRLKGDMRIVAVYYIIAYIKRVVGLYGIELSESAPPEIYSIVSKFASEDIGKLASERLIEFSESEKYSVVAEGRTKEIEYTGFANAVRDKISSAISELSKAIGLARRSEYAYLSMWAAVEGSTMRKPAVISVIGRPGEYKTLLAKELLPKFIETVYVRAEYDGGEADRKLNDLIKILSKASGIPVDVLDSSYGGIIYSIQLSSSSLSAYIDLAKLTAESERIGSQLSIDTLLALLNAAGFRVSVGRSPVSAFVIDNIMQRDISSYLYEFIPSERRVIKKSTIFSNPIVIVDEGFKVDVAEGVGSMLTVMSTAVHDQRAQVIVITSNDSEFIEVMRSGNPVVEPLLDRITLTFSTGVYGERPPDVTMYIPRAKLSSLELIAAKRFIDSIPMPEGVDLLIDALKYAMGYAYTVQRTKRGVEYMAVRRAMDISDDEDESVDVVYPMEFRFSFGRREVPWSEVKFIPSSRFDYTVRSIARFNAFLDGARYVDYRHLVSAISIAVRSRVAPPVSSPEELKMFYIRLSEHIEWFIGEFSSESQELIRLYRMIRDALSGKSTSGLEEMFINAITGGRRRIYMSTIAAIFSRLIGSSELNQQTIARLPEAVAASAVSFALAVDDMSAAGLYSAFKERFGDL